MSKYNSYDSFNNLLLGDLIKTFIGPLRRIKCLEDGSRSRYFRYACLLLEQLDVEHPVYQYVISVSSEFRKQYGERAADDLLFFIHSWSRGIVDLIDMGIPMTSISFHMKELIIECIQHIEAKRIQISEFAKGSQNLGRARTDSFRVPTSKENMYNSASNDVQKNVVVVGDDFFNTSSLCTEAKLEGDILATQEGKTNNKIALKDSFSVHHIKESSDGHKGTESVSGENRTNTDSCSSNESGIEMIHLEMKNIASEIEEDDDTSWFFDDVDSSDKIFTVKCSDSKVAELSDRRQTEIIGDDCEMSEDEGNSEDSRAILADIEKLKDDIENDLKRIKENTERIKQFNVHESTGNDLQNNDRFNTEIDEDFDSCFDLSDSEFSDCIEEKDYNASKTSEKRCWNENKSDSSKPIEEFRIIQLKFANTEEKEKEKHLVNKAVEKPSQVSGSVDIFKCPSSKVDVSIANKNSTLGIELQMCQREYSKTQEMLKRVENYEDCKAIGTKFEKNVAFKSCQNKASYHANMSGYRGDICHQNNAKVNIKGSVNKPQQESFGVSKSDNCDRWKHGKRSLNEGKLQEINSLLDSVGKGSRTNVHKGGVSLKFHSRHFKGTECEEAEQKETAIIDHSEVSDSYEDGGNENGPNDGISIAHSTKLKDSDTVSSGSRSKQSNLNHSLKSEENSSVASKSDRCFKVKADRSHHCIDLKEIDHMLKDVKSVSRRIIDSKKVDIQTQVLPEKKVQIFRNENYSEITDLSTARFHELTDEIRESIGRNFMSESKIPKFQSMQCSRMSNILLKSRHMNMEKELIENTDIFGMSFVSEPANQENSSLKHMGKHNFANTSVLCGKQITENKTQNEEVGNETGNEVLKREIQRVVMGVNYDGDEGINTAVCDVVLKQSRHGKPRLNMELVDCYSRACMHGHPEVIDGVVVEASMETISSLQKLNGKQCRALLVNGDLTVAFRHKGYKPLKVKEFCTLERLKSGTCLSKLDGWLKDIIDALEKLSINILLVKGSLSEDIVSLCELLDVVSIDAIPYKQLVQLSEAAKVDMVTYVSLATEENVCTDVSISPLQQNWFDKMFAWNSKQEVVISLAGNNPQTVILCGVTPMLTDLKEQELLDCLHHVTSVLHYGYLVSGAGQTEQECIRLFDENLEILRRDQNSMWSQELQWKQLVLESMISSLRGYVHLFKDSDLVPGYAIEGYNSKIETWKTALNVVITINNVDSFVTTGLTEDATDIGTF